MFFSLKLFGSRGWGVVSVLDVQSLFFLLKKNWICAMTRHHVEPFDSGVRQLSHPLMIPLHCLFEQ